jgi:hypothetical protein
MTTEHFAEARGTRDRVAQATSTSTTELQDKIREPLVPSPLLQAAFKLRVVLADLFPELAAVSEWIPQSKQNFSVPGSSFVIPAPYYGPAGGAAGLLVEYNVEGQGTS